MSDLGRFYISDVGTSRYEMGYASTISVILFCVILVFRYVVMALLKLVGKSDSKKRSAR